MDDMQDLPNPLEQGATKLRQHCQQRKFHNPLDTGQKDNTDKAETGQVECSRGIGAGHVWAM